MNFVKTKPIMVCYIVKLDTVHIFLQIAELMESNVMAMRSRVAPQGKLLKASAKAWNEVAKILVLKYEVFCVV